MVRRRAPTWRAACVKASKFAFSTWPIVNGNDMRAPGQHSHTAHSGGFIAENTSSSLGADHPTPGSPVDQTANSVTELPTLARYTCALVWVDGISTTAAISLQPPRWMLGQCERGVVTVTRAPGAVGPQLVSVFCNEVNN